MLNKDKLKKAGVMLFGITIWIYLSYLIILTGISLTRQPIDNIYKQTNQ
jgi:hypothetical protein